MASFYNWVDLALKNSKVLVALGILLCGTTGYTIYDFIGKKHVVEEPEVEISIIDLPEKKPVAKAPPAIDHRKFPIDLMKKHIKVYH